MHFKPVLTISFLEWFSYSVVTWKFSISVCLTFLCRMSCIFSVQVYISFSKISWTFHWFSPGPGQVAQHQQCRDLISEIFLTLTSGQTVNTVRQWFFLMWPVTTYQDSLINLGKMTNMIFSGRTGLGCEWYWGPVRSHCLTWPGSGRWVRLGGGGLSGGGRWPPAHTSPQPTPRTTT